MPGLYKKTIALILLAAMLVIARPAPARADFWGSAEAAAIWTFTANKIEKSIQDTLLANLKMAALRIVQSRLMSLLGGKSGPSVPGVTGFIISDWKMFIYSSAMKYSNQVTTDFFSGLSSGTPSALQQRVINPAQMAVNANYWGMRPDLQNYVAGGDASKIFNPGATQNPWTAWRMAAAPQNDLAFTYLRAEGYKQAAQNQEAQAKIAEGQAGQGVKSKEATINQGPVRQATASNGNQVSVPAGSDYKGQSITTPGSVIGNLMNEVNTMPVKMLTLARSIPEVATAMVNQMITQIIQKGVTQMISGGSSGAGVNTQSIMNSSTSQMQSLVQSGVRSVVSPNNLFK